MPLKQSLNATEYGALPETERGNYKLVGQNYVPDIEGVENLPGLTSALAKERADRENAQAALKPFEGIDPAKYNELVELEKQVNVGKLTSKGEYDQAKQLIEQQATDRISTAEKRAEEKIITSQLTLGLIKGGVLPERLEDALEIARKTVRLAKDDNLEVVGADGKPTGVDFNKFVTEEFKAKKPYFYAPSNVSGTGAENGTRGKTIEGDLSGKSAFERLKAANEQQAATQQAALAST